MLSDLLKTAGSNLKFTLLEIGALPLGAEREPFHALLDLWPGSKVVAFEVDPVLCSELNSKAPEGIRFYPTAVGRRRERRPFYETRHPMCGSLYPPDERFADLFNNLDVMRLKQASTIDTVPLDEFAEAEDIGPVDFIKMDIQGAELEALQGATGLLRDTLAIVCEVEFVPLYEGQPLFGEVNAFLRDQGFTFHKFIGLAGRAAKPLVFNDNPNHAIQHLWADALFIRDPFHLEALSSDQLQKLAVLLATYGTPDLPHGLLLECDRRTGSALGRAYLETLIPPGPEEAVPSDPSKTALPLPGGISIVVPNALDLITTYVLQEQRDWFEDEIKFLRRLLAPGGQVVDIGANYGTYTLTMAHAVGASGRVWAFEPATSTASFLAESVALNGFSQVVLERSALSDACGSASLSLNLQSELNALVREAHPAGDTEVVTLTTLDACMDTFGWQRLDFMKIDAEGEESNILRGGRRFFHLLSPLVQYEIKAGNALHMELVEAFAVLGYASYRLVPGLDLLIPFDPASPADGYLLNLFCCKQDRADQLRAAGFLLEAPATPAGTGGDLASALALYSLSQDGAGAPGPRFQALEGSLRILERLCAEAPTAASCSALARVARDFGQRSLAVATLRQLLGLLASGKPTDLGEPFLPPLARFEAIPPGSAPDRWLLAAALEAFELLGSFSSFYTGASAQERLEAIQQLGFGSEEMARRLDLLRSRLNLPVPASSPSAETTCTPFPAEVTSVLGRYGRLAFPPDLGRQGLSLAEYGEYAQGELDLILPLVEPEAVVIDAGAGIGAYTLPLAQRVGSGGAVVAFEPHPTLHRILDANLTLNSVPNVLTYLMGLGSAEGECLIETGGGEEERVPVCRLDDFELERVDFIRLDAAGSESLIVDGALETLARCRPILYIEQGPPEQTPTLIQRLLDASYGLWWHTPRLFNPHNPRKNQADHFPGHVTVNLLAIPRGGRTPPRGLKPVLAPGDTWR